MLCLHTLTSVGLDGTKLLTSYVVRVVSVGGRKPLGAGSIPTADHLCERSILATGAGSGVSNVSALPTQGGFLEVGSLGMLTGVDSREYCAHLRLVFTKGKNLPNKRERVIRGSTVWSFFFQSLLLGAVIAQLGERQTEDLKVPCSIHGHGTLFLASCSWRRRVRVVKEVD